MEKGVNLVFHNKVIDGTAMKRLISRLIYHFGMAYTSNILDQVKTLGFQQATATSISLGIDDLLPIPSKGWLVQDAEIQSFLLEKHQHYGNVHAIEKLRQSIDVWHATSEYLRQEMNHNFRMTDPLNPVHIMSFSGARGNASQVHQLVGMRGLMSDTQGQMIELPIKSNLREGLSLTEYIVSCYGARKGVVDTSVRTADAGYLTRRLVEVVQHIVVRRTDCGTVRGLSVSSRNVPESLFIQTLIGRVLSDDIYIGPRCIAARNQDIGIGLINQFITFRAQPISVRTPFTCKSTSWICRLCYGRSTADGELVELGEAVGILAGQSIGEPGTQLTLRTFHTGGVFTGGTAEYLRAPSNGKIKFNENLVHPTRTRHGYPAFLCSIDLDVTIESEDILHNVTIPSKSFLLVQNDQYVESEQIIAEISRGTCTLDLNLKEIVQKYVYSDSGGEMHWSTDVYHAPKFQYGNVHLLPKTSHLWILSGAPGKFSIASFSLHQDQDQMKAHSLYVKRRDISNPSLTNDQARQKLVCSGFSVKKEDRIPDYSELNQIVGTGHYNHNLIYPAALHANFDFLAKRRRNRFIIPFQSIQERENELMPSSDLSINVPRNGIFHQNSIFAYFDDPRYRRKSSGITFTKYVTPEVNSIEVHSIVQKEDLIEEDSIEEHFIEEHFIEEDLIEEGLIEEHLIEEGLIEEDLIEEDLIEEHSIEEHLIEEDLIEEGLIEEDLIEYRGGTEFSPKDQVEMEVDRFFFIPEEVHHLPRSYSIMVRNNSIIGVDTQITFNTRSRVGGLVRVKRKKNRIELQIFSGDIHFPVATNKIFKPGILIPPGIGKTNLKVSKKLQNWIYVRRIKPTKKKSFFLVRTGITYEITDGINFTKALSPDRLQERDNVELQVVNYISYGNAKPSRVICNTSIQLVRTCLVLNWDQDKKIEEARPSFVEIMTNGLIRDFLRIDLVKSYISYTEKRNDPQCIYDNGSDRTNINPFYSTFVDSKVKVQIQPSLNQNQATVHTFLNRNKECQSLILLLSSNCSRIGPFNDGKSSNVITESILKNPLMQIRNSLGPLGTAFKIANFYSFYCLITYNQIWVTNYLQLDNFKEPFQVLKYYLMDEKGKIYNANPCSNIILNPFNLNWYFLHLNYCEKTSIKMSLGQFICENICIAKNSPHLKSGQVLIVQVDSVVLRSAKPYLVTPKTTIHGHYGEIVYEGDTLLSFLHEKSRSSDITQGLPKVEKMFEARSLDSISINLEKRVEGWNECLTKILGIPWGFLIGAELTLLQSRISLVNKIQKVYRSEGVQIHNKHIELIVRQITSKVVVSEDGMSNVFLPGELIGLFRAERMGRALEEPIHYKAVLLGITRTSLNTQSFISEASFQETARVLAKAALRGRIDWVKGLKENVVLGGMIPVGTGFNPTLRQSNNILLETKKKKNRFEGEMREIFLHPIKII